MLVRVMLVRSDVGASDVGASDVGAGEKTMARHRRQLEKLEGQMEELRRKTRSAFRKVDGVRGTRRTKVGTKKVATKSQTTARRKLRGR